MFVFEISSKKIILISVKDNLKSSDIENLGAKFYGRINFGKNNGYNIFIDSLINNYKNLYKSLSPWFKIKII